jgi:hypothetical protein
MTENDERKWHWQEGNKYAIEGIKTLLLLNGGAAVALLAFIGNWETTSGPRPLIGSALVCFGVGAFFAALGFIGAYLTQLNYGSNKWPVGQRWHIATYLPVLVSALAFCAGLFFAWRNLPI